jgi:hypothetical protein
MTVKLTATGDMRRKYYLLLAGLTVVYLALVFVTPIDQAVLDKYHLSLLSAQLLNMAILLPLVAIWTIAFYGFITIKRYAALIKSDDDGQGFQLLGHGLAVLGIGMVLSSIATAIINLITRQNLHLIPRGVIITNYITVLIAFASYWYMYRGSRKLVGVATRNKDDFPYARLFGALYFIFGVIFAHAAVTNPQRSAPATVLAHGIYYLPNWLLLTTVIVPLIASWYIGMLAVSNIEHYRRRVNGVIYRSQLKFVALGISIIIIVSVGVQILTLFSKNTSEYSLSALLLLIFALLAVIASGFIMVAVGAKRLIQLEGQ